MKLATKQLLLPLAPRPPQVFDNFIAGPNAAALAQMQAWSTPSAPIYLWGSAASGKTHLLRALTHRCGASGRSTGWFDPDEALPWVFESGTELLVLDRCDALDTERQRAAFGLFVEATAAGAQVVAAGRLPPVDLPLRDDLRSRLGWGDIHALAPLDEADTRLALHTEALGRGMQLPDDVIDHLLTRFPRDLTHLMRLLDRLDEFGLAKHRRATVALVRELIDEDASIASETAPLDIP